MKAQLTKEEQAIREYNKAEIAKEDPWAFLKWFVYTKDEHDHVNAIKKFPEKAMYRVITRCWLEHDVLFIEKSRQVMMTYIMANLFLWDALFKKGRLIAYQSKKEDDAAGIIERARIAYNKLLYLEFPGLPKIKRVGEKSGTITKLQFEDQLSNIWGIPQGPDILAGNTFSGVLADEMNLQPRFREGYGGAKPTIDGGGKYIAQGTARGHSYAYKLMHNINPKTDEKLGGNVLDSNAVTHIRFKADPSLSEEQQRLWIENKIISLPDKEFNSIPIEELVACMPGMRYWVTSNGYHCLRVHYTADPDKHLVTAKGKAWYERYRRAWDDDMWEQEMEINHDTYQGKPIISNWKRNVFVKKTEYDRSLPLILGVDFGTQLCGALFAQHSPIQGFNDKQLRFLDELILENSNSIALATAIVDKIKAKWPSAWDEANFLTYVDPAGHQRRETTSDKSMDTSVKIFQSYGLKPKSRKIGIVDSTDLVKSIFSRTLPNGEPSVIIDPLCEYLIKVFGGGWHYPDLDDSKHIGKPEKDGVYDHGGDMARHIFSNCFKSRDIGPQVPPGPKITAIRDRSTGRIKGWKKTYPRRRTHA